MRKHILHQNKKLYYSISGAGPAVMLVHGFGEDGTVWKNQLQALQKNYRLIIPDLPGSGESELNDDVSIEAMAEALLAIADEENLSSFVMIGHSMGGYITLAFAEKYDTRLKALGLFHSSAYADNTAKKEAREKSIAFIKKHGSFEFLKQSTPNLFIETYRTQHNNVITAMIEQYKNFNPTALINYYHAMIQRPDRTHVLGIFNKPVLWILGEYDIAVPLKDGLQQTHLSQLSYISVFTASGHMGMLEESIKANEILVQFLNDVC